MRIFEHADSTTDARVWQLGEDPHFTNHFYTDNPSFSGDSRQFIFMGGPDYFKDCQIFLCDIPSRTIQPASARRGISQAVFSPARPEVVYTVPKDGVATLYRTQLASGETTELTRITGLSAHYELGAITPSGDKYATGVTWTNGISAVLEVDLASGVVTTIHEHEDLYNPHMNYSPCGRWLSLQFNHAGRYVDGQWVPKTEPPGLKNRVRVWDGSKRVLVDLPFAPGPNEDIQGHQAWAGPDSLLLATIISFVHNRWQGSIWAARPGDLQARCVSDAFDWRHPSATLDGKTIACDEWDNKDLHLLDTATGRHELLCHTGSVDWDKLRGVPAHSLQQWHPHPTISPDGRSVLFNSNRTGTAHAYVALR